MNRLNIVTLSGWAQPADALEVIAPGATHVDYAANATPQEVLEYLSAHHPHADVLIGWSLGGQLAVRALAEGAVRASALVLIGTPWQYLRCERFAHGMGAETYRLFREGYLQDTARTCRRFSGLIAMGDVHERRIATELEPNNVIAREVERWLPWLEDLASQSLVSHALAHLPPALILHGREDAVIYPAHAEALHASLPGSRLELLPGCGHAPHLHDAPRIQRIIEEYVAHHGL